MKSTQLSCPTSTLSNEELLALIISSCKKSQNSLIMAKKITQTFGFNNILHKNFQDFERLEGLNATKINRLIASFEIARRLAFSKKVPLMLTPLEIWNELREIRKKSKEYFIIFYLDSRNQEITREIISIGSLNASIVHPREVFEPAVKNHASHIILAHNHPSNDPAPSEADLVVTGRLLECGNILGIQIVDHVIVTPKTFFSFREQKML